MKKIISVFLIIFLSSVSIFAQNENSGGIKSGYLEIGKAKIYYEEKGDGVPLLMIHGGFLDRRMWDLQFEYFSKDYRVIRYDVRNHGLTTSGAEIFTNYDDLNTLMDSMKISRAVIMGLSLGGLITIDFALTHPEKVMALIPVSTGLSGFDGKDKEWKEFDKKINIEFTNNNEEGAIELMLKTWTDGLQRKPGEVSKEVRGKTKIMLKSTFEKPDTMRIPGKLTPPADKRLEEIKLPVLTIYGDKDLQGIIDIAERIKKEIKDSRVEIIRGAAHMVNMEFPDEFNKIVEEFLKETIKDIRTTKAETLINENKNNPDFIIVDVRTPEEYASGHIGGAENIDIKTADFGDKLDKLDRNKTYLVYCKSGGRSYKASEKMKAIGFTKVYNMLGGITKWTAEKKEIITN